MTAFTAAPWRIVSERDDELKIKGPSDEWIADCADGFWSDETDGWIMAVESEANARLIADAPAMLRLLHLYAFEGDYTGRPTAAQIQAEARAIVEAHTA